MPKMARPLSVRAHLRERRAGHAHLTFERDAEGGARRARALEKGLEVALCGGPLTGRGVEMTEHEAPVTLSAGGLGERVDRVLELPDRLACSDARKGEVRAIKRLVLRAPAHRAIERGGGLVVALG